MTQMLASNVFDEPVLEVAGNIIRPMLYSRDSLEMFWNKAKRHRNLFNIEIRDSFKVFASLFLAQHGEFEVEARGIVWVVNEFDAVFYLTNIFPGQQATAHVAIFRKSARDPIIGREMVKYVFRTFQFHRLNAEVPVYVKSEFFDYVKALGFLEEGNRRKSTWFDNKWFDTRLYGVLATEMLGVNALNGDN